MKYAARTSAGAWTGAIYDQLTDAIRAHHAGFDEELVEVLSLADAGTDEAPDWQATLPSIEARRAAMEVSRFQARAALQAAGLLQDVEALITASGNPVIQLAWADAQVFRRDSPAILALAGAANLTPEAVDQLFEAAAQIVA